MTTSLRCDFSYCNRRVVLSYKRQFAVKTNLTKPLNQCLHTFWKWGFMVLSMLFFFSQIATGQVSFQANHTSGCTPLGVVVSVTSPSAGNIQSYSWTITTPSGGVLTASSSSYTAIFSQPGSYGVSLTINGNQTQSIPNFITVHALPSADFSVDDAIGCFPHCVQFSDLSTPGSAPITSWSWDFGNGISSSDQNPENCYGQVGTFTPVFSVNDANGCFAVKTAPALISVHNNFPVANFTRSSQLDCNPPVDITMSNSSTGNSELTSIWDFGDGTTQTVNGIETVSHTYQSIGNFNACLTVVNNIGCEKQKCLPITIFNTADAQFTVSTTEQCQGKPFVFTSTTIPVPPTFQWDFDSNGTVDNTNPSPSYIYPLPGVYTPKLKVIYSNTCMDIVQGPALTVLDGIDIHFNTLDTASCSIPYTAEIINTTTGPGILSYEWFVNGVSVGTSTNLTYTFNDFGDYDIKLKASSSTGCAAQLTKEDMVVVQEPVVSFENGISVCTDMPVPIFNVIVNSVEPVAFYYWDFDNDGVVDSEGITPNYTYSSPGTYTITLTIETVSGCTASETSPQSINVLEEVQTNLSASTYTTCAGEPVTFCVDQQPGNTYSWNFYDGSGWVTMALNETCIIHDYADTGYFDLSLTVFNGACNVLETFENFIYVTPPVALFEYMVSCDGLEVEVSDISIEADYVTWDFGDGTALVTDDSNPTHIYDTPGEYEITITAYNNTLGCPDTHSKTVKVAAPDPTVSFSPTSGCPPLHVGIFPQSFNSSWDISVSNGDHIIANWSEVNNQWQVSYTHNGSTTNYSIPEIDSNFLPEIIVEEQGDYNVTIIVTDVNGCDADLSYDGIIHVASNPDFASFTQTLIDWCNSTSIRYTPELSGLTSIEWTFGDGTTSNDESPVHVYNPPYNYSQPLNTTLTATNNQGCSSTVTQTLEVEFPATPNFSTPNMTHCISDEVTFSNTSVGPMGMTYTWDFGDGQTSTLKNPTHSYSENGDYEVCLTVTTPSGCARTKCTTTPVKVQNPNASFSYSSNVNNCLFGVAFTNTTPGVSASAVWDFGDNQSGGGDILYHTYSIGVYDVMLIVSNQFGCVDTTMVNDILNYGNQIGPFSAELDDTNCAPFEITLSAFNTADTYFDYFWDFNDGGGDPSGSTITNYTYLQPGIYCPSVIMTDPNGCAKLITCTDSIFVDEFVMAYQTPGYLCYGDTLLFTAENADSYEWNSTASVLQGTTSNEFLLFPEADETFYLTGHLADCERTDTIYVIVKPLPVVLLDVVSDVCFGDAILQLEGGRPIGNPGYYTVNGEETSTFDPTMDANQTYEVSYHFTDIFGCSNSATKPVTLHALPILHFPDYDDICDNHPSFLLNQAQPAGGYYTLGGDTVQTFEPNVGFGSYSIQYTYTDANQCSNSATSQLIVHAAPVVQLLFENTCLNTPFQVQNETFVPDGSIVSISHWNFESEGIDNQFAHTPVIFPAFGHYEFSYSAETEHGCSSSLDTTVRIYAVPQMAITPDHVCQKQESTFFDLSTIAEGSVASRIWQAETQVFFSEADSLNYAFQNYDSQPITLIATSNFGCRDTLVKEIQVRAAPLVQIDYDLGCLGEETNFTAEASIPLGGIVSKQWNYGDGHPDEFGLDVDNLYETPGIYTVTFKAVSNLGCTTVVQKDITIYELPTVDFELEYNEVCAGNPVSFLDMSGTGDGSNIVEWTWWIDNYPASTAQNPIFRIPQAGTYDITLTVVSDKGCSNDSTAHLALSVWPLPQAGFIAEEDLYMSDPILNIYNSSSEDVTEWYYEFGDGQFATFREGSHLYEDYGEFGITLFVTNVFGCKDTAIKQITVHPDMLLYIPNAFTPDGNGHNEIFIPVYSGSEVIEYSFEIFDRWGQMIFRSKDVSVGWDGFVNGMAAQDGVYNWRLRYRTDHSEETIFKQGSVTLLR